MGALLLACDRRPALTPVGASDFPLGDAPELLHDIVPTTPLTAQLLADPEILAQPGRMAIIGSYLAVIESSAPRKLLLFDRTTGRETDRVVSQAAPISRTRSFWSLDVPVALQPTLLTYDMTTNRVSKFTLDSANGRIVASVDSFLAPRTSELLTDVRRLTDGSYLGRGFLTSGGVVRLDSLGDVLAQGGTESPGDPQVPARVRAHAYQAIMSPNPTRTRFAVAYRHAGALDVIDVAGQVAHVASVPYAYTPRYGAAMRGSQLSMVLDRAHERLGYADVATTSCCIYALFSGRLIAKYPRNSELGRFVHVFDWQGRLLRVLRLDTALQTIAVDGQDSFLYGARRDPYSALVRFTLPRAESKSAGVRSAQTR